MNGDSQWSKQVACFAPANQVLLAINHNNSVADNNSVVDSE